MRFSNCVSETMPASVTALEQLPRFSNGAEATAAVQLLRFSNCRDSETGPAVQRLRLSNYLMTLMVSCDWDQSNHVQNLLTSMVHVQDLVTSMAIWEQSNHVQNLMTSMI